MNTIEKKYTFSDIIGYEKEKEELQEIKKFILEVDKYEDIGARIPKGILLVGESGNGKTLMAKVLASETNIPFYSIGDELDDEENVKSIRNIFNKARENTPCIVFIDEIDKMDCNNDFANPFMEKESSFTRELLTQMDGFQTNSGIVVIATANATFNLNKSLLRSGRFDRVIGIRMPNKQERKDLFEYYSKNKKIETGVDYERLAIRTSGLCCADIDNILNDAALMSIRENKELISTSSIEKAIDRIMMGDAVENKVSEERRKETAIHEIGHAVVAVVTGNKDSLNKISIISRGQTLGFNRFSLSDDELRVNITTKKDIENNIKIAYGGLVAEELMLSNITSGCVGDIEKAKMQANAMVRQYGMMGVTNSINSSMFREDGEVSQKKLIRIEKLTDRILNSAYKETKKILKANKVLFNKLYDKLLENNVLYKEDIDEVLKEVNNL